MFIMEIIDNFGIKPLLLAAQVVNFLILLYILKRFLYKPLLKVLDERKQKISQSLKNADEIEKRLVAIENDRGEKLQEAAKEAKEILTEATKNADRIVAEAHLKAEKDIEKLMEKSKGAMDLEKDKLYQQIRIDLADLVALGLEKVAGKTLTEKDKKELLEKSLKEIK